MTRTAAASSSSPVAARGAAASAFDAHVPEIRFRPAPEVYAKAARVAAGLGITVTEVARMGLAQISSAREIRLDSAESMPATRDARDAPGGHAARDLPIHGVGLGRIAQVASAAARAADRSHVQAGRAKAAAPRGVKVR